MISLTLSYFRLVRSVWCIPCGILHDLAKVEKNMKIRRPYNDDVIDHIKNTKKKVLSNIDDDIRF